MRRRTLALFIKFNKINNLNLSLKKSDDVIYIVGFCLRRFENK